MSEYDVLIRFSETAQTADQAMINVLKLLPELPAILRKSRATIVAIDIDRGVECDGEELLRKQV